MQTSFANIGRDIKTCYIQVTWTTNTESIHAMHTSDIAYGCTHLKVQEHMTNWTKHYSLPHIQMQVNAAYTHAYTRVFSNSPQAFENRSVLSLVLNAATVVADVRTGGDLFQRRWTSDAETSVSSHVIQLINVLTVSVLKGEPLWSVGFQK